MVSERQQVNVRLQRTGVDHSFVPEETVTSSKNGFVLTADTESKSSSPPLFAEGASEGDVVLHCGIQEPGFLSSVGHRVSVLTGASWGKKKRRGGGEGGGRDLSETN